MKPLSIPEETERKTVLILRILSEFKEPTGARIIARRMQDLGVRLSERAVRYHLQWMDERGFTQLAGRRDGRVITDAGFEELTHARVQDKIGFVSSKIDMLAFQTTFDPSRRQGLLPINVSFFQKDQFPDAIEAMNPAFQEGYSVSERVSYAPEGERLGAVFIPKGMIGFATVCSIVINGMLLKNGIPADSKFGGILQIRQGKPLRFVELINYAGSSLDPSEIFIRGKMTSVQKAIQVGEGKILANFREVPEPSLQSVKTLLDLLREAGVEGVMSIGEVGESVCQVPADVHKIGMILMGGLNPVACAQEAGIEGENRAMSTLMAYEEMIPFSEFRKQF